MLKYVYFILQIALLYIIFFIGEWIQLITHMPIPGSIIGMIILFLALIFKVIRREWISLGSNFLLNNLPLLFVPATVGIIDYLELFSGYGFLSLIISFVSTMVVFIASSIISEKLLKNEKRLLNNKELHL
ncbi:CidA/LrgA family protein [Metabacillus halosaccharovorans]|uniref:CidA/LrgA family protein n=1 Tax=Metabacillus halosaccharovorans TaxID=930124 RepID=UPI000995B132|nr:CidA/LrgA family holin-like protein [Metabacillus halosaccharovorans]